MGTIFSYVVLDTTPIVQATHPLAGIFIFLGPLQRFWLIKEPPKAYTSTYVYLLPFKQSLQKLGHSAAVAKYMFNKLRI